MSATKKVTRPTSVPTEPAVEADEVEDEAAEEAEEDVAAVEAEEDASKATATIVASQDTGPRNAGIKKKMQHKGRSTTRLELAAAKQLTSTSTAEAASNFF